MTRRVWLVALIVLTLSLILAFPLRDIVQQTIVVPLAYFFWALNLFYQSTPQLAAWILIVLLVIVLAVQSLSPKERYVARPVPKSRPPQGSVENLAEWIHKSEGGVYFKWLVANRLGNLAYQTLVQREGDPSRSVFAPLVGADWRPSTRLQKYLEIGLHGSFAEHAHFKRGKDSPASPLDLEVGEAVTFLESQLETQRDNSH